MSRDKMDMSLDDIVNEGTAKAANLRPKNWKGNFNQRRFEARPSTSKDASPGYVASNKILVSNLSVNSVTEQDVHDLFSEVGTLIQYTLFHDRQGKSLGTAIVEFKDPAMAKMAQKKYNKVEFDNHPMNIQFIVNESIRERLSGVNQVQSGRVEKRFGQNSYGGKRNHFQKRTSFHKKNNNNSLGSETNKEALDEEMDTYFANQLKNP